jgi:hypothetical protein
MKINVQAKSIEDLIIDTSLLYELPCKCGKCESDDLGFRFRTSKSNGKKYDFFELKCLACEATYALGQKMEGGLYPRGHKDTGEWEVKYEGNDRSDDSRDHQRSDDRGRGRGRDDDRGSDRGRGRDDRRGGDRDRGREESSDRGRGGYRKDDAGDGPINDY